LLNIVGGGVRRITKASASFQTCAKKNKPLRHKFKTWASKGAMELRASNKLAKINIVFIFIL